MDLSDIKGLGPAKQDALRQAGYGSVEDLGAIDLRKNVEVQGVSRDSLKVLKQRARRLLAAEGKPVPKAPYRRNGKTTAPRATTPKTIAPEPVKTAPEPVASFEKKPGLLRRILTRRS